MKRLLLCLVLLNSFLWAGAHKVVSTRVVQGVGEGTTRSEAITEALVDALGQLQGVRLSKTAFSKDQLIETDTSSKSAYLYSSKIKKITHGKVNSYKVVEVMEIEPHHYKAIVEVTKRTTRYNYKDVGYNPHNRRTLAVLPFEYKPTYSLHGITIDGRELSRRLTQSIINKLTQTRKFTILDRQNSKYYEFEKSFLLSPGTDPVELVRIGKRLGADYFIIGQILDFGTDEKEGNYLLGPDETTEEAYATIAYRVLYVPRQQIKWSDTIDIAFEVPPTKRAESLTVKAGDKIAQVLVDQIMFNIYPPRIVRSSGKHIILNMGGNTLHPGDRFEIYALGKKIYDPYTKESLGREEIKIGELEITKVLPKFSYAKVIEGKAKKGAIIRPAASNYNENQNVGKESMFEEMFHK
ncbi:MULTISPECIES: CsgG/HfaB family protein [unclassified Nitratiruptor]|uniref:CsgG/HfaB family protein n=1 Tax=unclassified Nitratiruptor TaxID=2624044 RepID=UPI001916ACF3|nr:MULTISPECIES: CsgG/HfaB family protein [unclassified Nitratiruptor]BCD60980.1 hypothetical protein NitYY0810_C1760 [Nitratiruptor sp. YY08-10]BCD64912.1 hypothetical protein NitYY0814_C1768 [Nitratiruptor sp. YY08-14]